MKLSIVTISYNQAEFLEIALRSVISQKTDDIEYIVVDPGSTDGSREIIERYADHIDHIIFEKDAGPADGLNKGFARATGDWFGYINSDDFYLEDGLRRAFDAAGRYSDAGAFVGGGYLVDGQGWIIKRSISTRYSLLRALNGAAFSLQQATFYRRDAFQAVGGFNLANRTCWDGEILVAMMARGFTIARIPEDIGAFRIHAQSITGSGRLSKAYRGDLDRIFAETLGRPRNGWDRHVIAPALRFASRLGDPWRTASLARDRIFRQLRVQRLSVDSDAG